MDLPVSESSAGGALHSRSEDPWWEGAFARLSPRARRHLPFLGLFISGVAVETLEAFVGSGDRQQELYCELVGESLDAAGWESVLDEAAGMGMLLAVHCGLYELTPAVSTFLRRKLVAAVGAAGLERLGSEFAQFYAAWAAHVEENVLAGQEQARRRIAVEEANLRRALRLAEIDEDWAAALPLARVLKEHYEGTDRAGEWHTLRTELLAGVGHEPPPPAGRDRTRLWLFLQGSAAGDTLARGELDPAEQSYRRILEVLDAAQDPLSEAFRGVVYHQLGLIALERRDHDQAEQWHRQALEIFAQLGLERSAADEYYQLGSISQERGQAEQAEECYRQALSIYERRGLPRYAGACYQQLGRIAEERGQSNQAEQCYARALALYEDLEQPLLLLNALAQMGLLCRKQERLAEAVAWYGRAWQVAVGLPEDLQGPIHAQLAGTMQAMGEEAFAAAWRQSLPGEPPVK